MPPSGFEDHLVCSYVLRNSLSQLLECSPNRFPVLRGGFHHHFLHLLLDKPFPQQLQLLRVVASVPALELVFVLDFDVSHNHASFFLWTSIPGIGLSTLSLGRDNDHLFALSRTLRIRQAFGLSVSTDYSISPLPTVLDYCQTLSDFHEISWARRALQ
jgi:hypothetical protein